MPRYYYLAIIGALIVVAGAWALWPSGKPAAPVFVPIVIKTTPGVEVQYLNTDLNFSFQMPDGVYAQEFDGAKKGEVVRLHEADSTTHLAVFVAPSKTDPAAFTPDTVLKDAPGTLVASTSAVTLPGGITGLEFDSTSTAWGGPTRELWFAYKGNRYMVSVPRPDYALLDFTANSWQWR